MTKPPRLFIYELHHEPFVEAHHLAKYLGYMQQSSLRKQVLSDWKEHFCDADFVLIHEEPLLRRYEREHEARGFGELRPVKAQRGRMFFRRSGIEKIMKLTSKNIEPLVEALSAFPAAVFSEQLKLGLNALETREGFEDLKASVQQSWGSPSKKEVIVSPLSETAPVVPNDPQVDPAAPFGVRQFEHKVLETLLHHLLEIDVPALKQLALHSAEVALGRPLPEIRAHLKNKRSPERQAELLERPKTSLEKKATPGPFPEAGSSFYRLREIGAAAGGYSSVTAGKAADIVAARLGFTPAHIRRVRLPFNSVGDEPDRHGRMRKMFRFNGRFSNLVVAELRSNPAFHPMAAVPLEDFSRSGAIFPKLSRGPFED